ncbi:MAG: branched-chain amino acid ABC transporter ATP-binding protein/permease [Planctomycetota bacterium]|nr:branched-chain amino acid ABC transporter ATP-binding protein/permease [Planctomycetota bacterium]
MLAIWLTLTLSLNLINGFCGLFSLGHHGLWAVGAYASAATTLYMGHQVIPVDGSLPYWEPTWFSFCLSFPVGVGVAALFGLLVGVPCLRLRGDYLAIATLGFSEIVRNVVQNSEKLGQSLGMSFPNIVRTTVKERRTSYFIFLLLAWAVVAVTLLVLRNLVHSTHGRAIRAIRDDERAAELLGVNLTRYKVLVFVIGAAFAGLAGAVFSGYNAQVTPEHFKFEVGVLMVVMVVLGGMGSFTGTILATVLLYFAPVLLALWLPATRIPVFYDPTQGGWVHREVKELWQVLFSLLLIVVVVVRPEGIMGGYELRWPWRRKRKEEKAAKSRLPTVSGQERKEKNQEPRANSQQPLLVARSLNKHFGGLYAVSDFSISLTPGEIVGLIGPNGAGKTTVFNLLTGVYKPDGGQIELGGTSLVGLSPDRVTGRGIARTFQNIRLFGQMTVLENVKVGFQVHNTAGLASTVLRGRAFHDEEARVETEARELLRLLGLEEHAETLSRNLPYGQQRKLEIARALATAPKVLLLDEPAAGMNDSESAALRELLLRIRERYNLTMLVIEHDMPFVMGLAGRLLVLDDGLTIAEGTAAEIRTNPAVIEAYLGVEAGV